MILQKEKKQLRFLAISDTHESLHILEKIAYHEQGDFFIHAGDFTLYGEQSYFIKFCQILDKLKFKHKIVIAGNHEISLDNGNIEQKKKKRYLYHHPCTLQREQIIQMLKKRCHYLEHEPITLEGIKFFGSPYTNYYCGSAFQYESQYEEVIWNDLPDQIDILITHSPPHGILDRNAKGVLCGSTKLRQKVEEINPKIHIFGHIHEAHGNIRHGKTNFLNVAAIQSFQKTFKFIYPRPES